jgi:hypothetical protein
MTPKPPPARPDLNVCIVGANILGMSIMRAARVSGISRVAVWERDACAMDLRSLVRVFHRWAVPLYVRSSGHNPKHVHCAKDIHWRGPFTHTVICDGREIEGAVTGGTRTDPQWGKIMPPRECSHNLALNTEGRDIVESLLRALYIIKSTPGLPVNDPAVRAALGIEEGFGSLAIDDFLNEDRESEVPA